MYQNNEHQDTVKYFLDWVDRNKIYSNADEVVANIDANKQRLNLANIKLNEFKDMLMKIRELATASPCLMRFCKSKVVELHFSNKISVTLWSFNSFIVFPTMTLPKHCDTCLSFSKSLPKDFRKFTNTLVVMLQLEISFSLDEFDKH